MSPRVVVIGGGAAGTLTAVHLMRAVGPAGVEIALIDRDGEFGPGVAYATRDPQHLLNVPAVRMGAISGEPEHFHLWLQRRGDPAGPETFMPRRVFGEYLGALLDETESAAQGAARLRRLRGDVVAIEEPGGAGPLRVVLAGGERVEADWAVLALGHLPGGDPVAVSEEMRESGIYVPNPWLPGALGAAREDDSVLVVGTGLSMVDVALSLSHGERGPSIRAVSRNGLVPRRHRDHLTSVNPFPLPLESGELGPVVAAVVEEIGRAGARGDDWRDVFDSMRGATPTVWRSLKISEKRRFLTELCRFWDVHRFRMAPQVADRFEALQRRGKVAVEAGSIAVLEPSARGARVTLRTTAQAAARTFDVDRVINCTGAGTDVLHNAPPLVEGLIASGLARPDELALGLDVEPGGALLDASGAASERIQVVGPLRKGVEWEAIGVTEIRDHAAAAAARILAGAEAGPAPLGATPPPAPIGEAA